MKVQAEKHLWFQGTSLNVETLRDFIEDAPDGANVTFTISAGDRPFDPNMAKVSVSWEQELR